MTFVVAATTSMWSLVSTALTSSTPLEQLVLCLLIALSIGSWALILMKVRMLIRATANAEHFLSVFEAAGDVESLDIASVQPSPLRSIYKAGMAAWDGNDGKETDAAANEKLLLRMRHAAKAAFAELRWGLGFLASISSAAPFIGLLGTVWGIIVTFQNLSDVKSASLAVVAPGISSALMATAAGLAVAIPAVLAYNWMLSRLDELQEQADVLVERMSFVLRHGGSIADEQAALQEHYTPLALPAIQVTPEVATAGPTRD
jgi:biopolymer transport protein TolQ